MSGVAVVIRDDEGGVLMGRRAKGKYKGLWCIPCGYVEYDEDIRDAAVREMREETGLEVDVGGVLAVHSNFHEPEKQTVGVWFAGSAPGGRPHPADGEFSELAYFLPESPPPLAFPTDALVLAQLASVSRSPDPGHHPLLPLACRIARSAAALVQRRRSEGLGTVGVKSSAVDMVTDIDREAEAQIVREITEARPDDGVLGEEGAVRAGSSGTRWIIDPVDGTTNLIFGVRAYAVVLAIETNGTVDAGVVHDVTANETYWGSRGNGAYRDGLPICASSASDLETSLIATGFAYDRDRREEQAKRLVGILPSIRDIRRLGSAALDLCRVAAGEVDGFFEDGLQRWDYEAGVLLVEEAGGRVTRKNDMVVATAPDIHDRLVALLGLDLGGLQASSGR